MYLEVEGRKCHPWHSPSYCQGANDWLDWFWFLKEQFRCCKLTSKKGGGGGLPSGGGRYPWQLHIFIENMIGRNENWI